LIAYGVSFVLFTSVVLVVMTRTRVMYRPNPLNFRLRGRPRSQYRGLELPVISARSAVKSRRRSRPARTVTVQSARKRARRFTPTVRYGSYQGLFRKPKKKATSNFFKKGIVIHNESGVVQSSTSCAYVGHGFANRAMVKAMCQALVRTLFEKVGLTMVSMTDRIQGNFAGAWVVAGGTMRLQYRTTVGEAIQELAFTVIADETFDGLAERLLAGFFYSIGVTADIFQLTGMFFSDSSTGSSRDVYVDLSNIKVLFDCDSWLTLQNRTAAVSTGPNDESNALDVANNPIEGKVYGGRGNGPMVRFGDQAAVAAVLIADSLSGQIGFDPEAAAVGFRMKFNLIRPPNLATLSYANKSSPVRLAPGAMKKGHLKYTATLKLNDWISKFKQVMQNAETDNIRMSSGSFEMYAFERMCNTRADEPAIQVGLELNQTYRCMLVSVKKGISTQHVIL